MRIMLTMNLPYEPALGGASKGNRLIAEMLSQRGHAVRVIVPAGEVSEISSNRPIETRSAPYQSSKRNFSVAQLQLSGVEVHVVTGPITATKCHFAEQLRAFQPDCVIVSSEDPMQILLEEAIKYDSTRVVYLVHTPSCLPLGPFSFDKGQRRSQLLGHVAVVVAVSRFCADYIRQWSTLNPVHVYLPIYGDPPFPRFGQFGQGWVGMINPCKYKGIDIFVDIASAFPEIEFSGIVSWGTTSDDRARMRAIPNIRVLASTVDIDNFYRRTQILLVPSLCLENFPMVVIEAMLRGIPVISSNVGGLPEAMLGGSYVLPVRPIETFTEEWDENKLRVPVIPLQDISPWRRVLSKLLRDQAAYELESVTAKDASEHFVTNLDLEPIEQIVHSVTSGSHRAR